jgi:hypothetical protein
MWNSFRQRSQRSTAVMIHQCRMVEYYDDHHHHQQHHFTGINNEPKMKYVIGFRRNSSVWLVIRVVAMYASVDVILLLPMLILINVLSIWHLIHVFTDPVT